MSTTDQKNDPSEASDPTKVFYDSFGNVKSEHWLDDQGRFHNDNGPAVVEYKVHSNGDLVAEREIWFLHGIRHRVGGPAMTIYGGSYGVKEVRFYENNQLHREYGPALITHNDDDTGEDWYYIHGKLHREDGPAYTFISSTGTPAEEQWFYHNKLHRADGPAWIFYTLEEKLLRSEKWYNNNNLHREDGPAVIEYGPSTFVYLNHTKPLYEQGPVVREKWYKFNIPLDNDTVEKLKVNLAKRAIIST